MAHTDFAGTVAARMKQLGYGQHAISKVLQPLSGAEAACSASFSHVTPVEEELMRHLHASGLGVKRIAGALGRSTDTISKHLFRRCKAKPARVGRKGCITDSNYKRIFNGYKRLLKNAPRQGGHCQDGEEGAEAQVQRQNFEPCTLGTWRPLPLSVRKAGFVTSGCQGSPCMGFGSCSQKSSPVG